MRYFNVTAVVSNYKTRREIHGCQINGLASRSFENFRDKDQVYIPNTIRIAQRRLFRFNLVNFNFFFFSMHTTRKELRAKTYRQLDIRARLVTNKTHVFHLSYRIRWHNESITETVKIDLSSIASCYAERILPI